MGSRSPEQRLNAFFSTLPSWHQKILQYNSSLTMEEHLAWQNSDYWQSGGKVEAEYLSLLRLCPAKWNEHCERRKQFLLSDGPLPMVGRPRKDELAEEALNLRQHENLSWARIAKKINLKYGEGTTTAGAVRKLIDYRREKTQR
jgi:hypothetical protein